MKQRGPKDRFHAWKAKHGFSSKTETGTVKKEDERVEEDEKKESSPFGGAGLDPEKGEGGLNSKT